MIAIVYHSAWGHTARQAAAVAAGVEDTRERALLLTVDEAQSRWDDLANADAIIFGTPTYMGGPSAAFKAFEESTSKHVLAKDLAWRDKLAAGFTNSGAPSGDKLGTLIQLTLFAAQHGMHWINVGLAPASEHEHNRFGFWLGAAAQSIKADGPPEADLAVARHLGRRVAETAVQLARGRVSLCISRSDLG
jgi:multimeric flavodoxin WrbA